MKNDKIKVVDIFVPSPYKSYVDENGKERIIKTNVMSREFLYNDVWKNSLHCNCEDVMVYFKNR